MFFWKRKKKQDENIETEEHVEPAAEVQEPAPEKELAAEGPETEPVPEAEPAAEAEPVADAEPEAGTEESAEVVEAEETPGAEPEAETAQEEPAEEEPVEAAEAEEAPESGQETEGPEEEPAQEKPAGAAEPEETPEEESDQEEPAGEESAEAVEVEETAGAEPEEETAEEGPVEAVEAEEAPESEPETKGPEEEVAQEKPAGAAEPEEISEEESGQEEPAEEKPVEAAGAEEAPESEPEEEPAEEEPVEPAQDVQVGETPGAETEAEAVTDSAEAATEPVETAEQPAETAAEPSQTAAAQPAPAEDDRQTPEESDAGSYYEEKEGGILGRVLLFVFLLLLVIGGAYYYGMTYSQTHFLENTYINNIDVSNMTAPEVEKMFYENTKEYSITINFRGGDTETIYGEQFGYKIKPSSSVGRILKQQDPYRWYQCFFRRADAEVKLETTYDPVRLRKAVQDLAIMQEDDMVKPVDAYITLNDTTFEIVDEVEGTYFDTSKVLAAVDEAAQKEETEVDVVSLGVYPEPKVRAKDEKIVKKCEELNHLVAGSMTWELPDGGKMTIDKNTTINWLSVDDDGNYYRDEDLWEEKVEVYVDELAMKVNTVGTEWDFHATGVGDITVDGGDYGYSVNKVDEREEVLELLLSGETEEREPYFYTKEFQGGGSGIGDTYIEANLSQQHVWIYVDGQLMIDTPCVSGNTSLGRGTPTGVFQILYKDTDVDLKGMQLADGQYSYISHVNYWMPFYSGCGFHDANWRSNFGGTIYRTNGSHGCVNLPPSVAASFYSYVQTGMPVVVFY